MKRKTVLERFIEKIVVNKETQCWNWIACKDAQGYAVMSVKINGKKYNRASRVAYTIFRGEVPYNLTIDHLCHNPKLCPNRSECTHIGCVNPAHLELVSVAENVRRANNYNRSKTHCPRGHRYSPENIYWDKAASHGRKTARKCKACVLKRAKIRWANRIFALSA